MEEHENFRIQVIVSRKLKDDGKVDFAIAAGSDLFSAPIWEGRKVDAVKFATGMVKIPLVKGGSLLFVKENTNLAGVTRVGEAFSNYMGLWPRNDDVSQEKKDRYGPGQFASATLVTSNEWDVHDDGDLVYNVETNEPVGHRGNGGPPRWKGPLDGQNGWRWGGYEKLYKAPRRVDCSGRNATTNNPTLEFLVYAGGPKDVHNMTNPNKETMEGMTEIGKLVIDLGMPVYGAYSKAYDSEIDLDAKFIKTHEPLHGPQAQTWHTMGGFVDHTTRTTACHS